MGARAITVTFLVLCALAAAGCGGSDKGGSSGGGESKVLVGAGSTPVSYTHLTLPTIYSV